MPQPLGIGDVVGGRYRITRHVVTSADQDIVFQATDQVLGREVSVLLASRANAKQVATSAKELATGERHSHVEVLDLGLAEDRTFLISTLVDPNDLLDLVVPDSAPFVEPYYTDSLGSELFGRSREMQPQTYDDDAEYYARLHSGRASGEREQRRRDRRPAFLDKVTPAHRPAPTPEPQHTQAQLESALESAGDAHGLSISQEISRIEFSLRADLDEVSVSSAADSAEDTISAVKQRPEAQATAPAGDLASESPSSDKPFDVSAPQDPVSEPVPAAELHAEPVKPVSAQSEPAVDDLIAEGEEVVDNPPEEPLEEYDRHNLDRLAPPHPDENSHAGPSGPMDPTEGAGASQDPASFTSLISAVKTNSPTAFPTSAPKAQPQSDERASPQLSRWIAAGVLGILILIAAIIVFIALTS